MLVTDNALVCICTLITGLMIHTSKSVD